MKQELPAAVAKLARLIDARAEARARELYEERMKLEAEAVAAEFEVDAPASEPTEPEHD